MIQVGWGAGKVPKDLKLLIEESAATRYRRWLSASASEARGGHSLRPIQVRYGERVSQRPDDAEISDLAVAAARGDDRALERFIRLTRDDVWRLVGYLGDRRNADDLTQETYLRAIKSLPRYSGTAPARTWLLSIARRVVVDQVRYDMSRPRMDLHSSADTIASITARSERHEMRVEVQMLIDALDTDRREAFVLTQVLGVSYAEAASICGCPVGTIRSRIARARDDLQAAMTADRRRYG